MYCVMLPPSVAPGPGLGPALHPEDARPRDPALDLRQPTTKGPGKPSVCLFSEAGVVCFYLLYLFTCVEYQTFREVQVNKHRS